jgi:uncharacterized membrane protein YhaH (DUF805 family)
MESFPPSLWIAMVLALSFEMLLVAAMVRILHRTGFSGWWALLVFVPFVNILAFWVFSRARWRVAPS